MDTRYWRNLPWDGEGWGGGIDPLLAALSVWAAREWRLQRAPRLHGVLALVSKILWLLAAGARVRQFARRLKGVSPLVVYWDCVRTGAMPLEAHVWRSLHATPHPLPARASALLMSRLGAPEAHRLLADKLATANALSATGLSFPKLIQFISCAQPIALSLETRLGAALFVKPRRGHGGLGGFALIEHRGEWRTDGRSVSTPELLARMAQLVRYDDVLIQEHVLAAPDLADLASDGRAPVLRLTTTCLPNAEPFLHSALLTIAVPDRNPQNFLNGTVLAPIDIRSGRVLRGLSLGRPHDRLDRLPWNAALLNGRRLPNFGEAAAAAQRAMAALPALPVVHWDLILSAEGPIFLEGNTSGNWIIASLPERDGVAECALSHILAKWH